MKTQNLLPHPHWTGLHGNGFAFSQTSGAFAQTPYQTPLPMNRVPLFIVQPGMVQHHSGAHRRPDL